MHCALPTPQHKRNVHCRWSISQKSLTKCVITALHLTASVTTNRGECESSAPTMMYCGERHSSVCVRICSRRLALNSNGAPYVSLLKRSPQLASVIAEYYWLFQISKTQTQAEQRVQWAVAARNQINSTFATMREVWVRQKRGLDHCYRASIIISCGMGSKGRQRR